MKPLFLALFLYSVTAWPDFNFHSMKKCFESTQGKHNYKQPVRYLTDQKDTFESLGSHETQISEALLFRETNDDNIKLHVIQNTSTTLPIQGTGLTTKAARTLPYLGYRLGYRTPNIRQTFIMPVTSSQDCFNHQDSRFIEIGGTCQRSDDKRCFTFPVEFSLSSAGGFCEFDRKVGERGHHPTLTPKDIEMKDTSAMLGKALVAHLNFLVGEMEAGKLTVDKATLMKALYDPGSCYHMIPEIPVEATALMTRLLCETPEPRPSICIQSVPMNPLMEGPGVDNFGPDGIKPIPANYPIHR